jgi:ATP-dependent helicase/nuclease subunit B
MIDHPVGEARPVPPPQPRPPVVRRPRALSVTEIETWLADPYAIHAKHILRLRKLDPLDADADAMLFGTIVHDGLHRFWTETGGAWPHDAAAHIERALSATLDATEVRPGIAAWWRPRLARIAGFVAVTETVRRLFEPPPRVATELTGAWELSGPAGSFTLRGRADRIDVTSDGQLVIHDYKTGTVPSATKVRSGHAPQLTLEACMAAAGAFPGLIGETAELIYWRLSGTGSTGLDIRPIRDGKDGTVADAIAIAKAGLINLIETYDDPTKAYIAQPDPNRQVRYSDYRQLARVAEWERIGGGGDDTADRAEDSEDDA